MQYSVIKLVELPVGTELRLPAARLSGRRHLLTKGSDGYLCVSVRRLTLFPGEDVDLAKGLSASLMASMRSKLAGQVVGQPAPAPEAAAPVPGTPIKAPDAKLAGQVVGQPAPAPEAASIARKPQPQTKR